MIAMCFSCNSTINAQEKSKVKTDFSAVREKLKPIVYGTGDFAKGGPAFSDFIWSTDATYMSSANGCHTIQVRVLITYEGQTSLVASDIVVVCEPKVKAAELQQHRADNKYERSCEGVLPDGNAVSKDNADEVYCLYELLTVNTDIYNSYKKTIAKY